MLLSQCIYFFFLSEIILKYLISKSNILTSLISKNSSLSTWAIVLYILIPFKQNLIIMLNLVITYNKRVLKLQMFIPIQKSFLWIKLFQTNFIPFIHNFVLSCNTLPNIITFKVYHWGSIFLTGFIIFESIIQNDISSTSDKFFTPRVKGSKLIKGLLPDLNSHCSIYCQILWKDVVFNYDSLGINICV